jgi:hypothetical protein
MDWYTYWTGIILENFSGHAKCCCEEPGRNWFKCCHRNKLTQRTVAIMDGSACIKLSVLSAVNFISEGRRLVMLQSINTLWNVLLKWSCHQELWQCSQTEGKRRGWLAHFTSSQSVVWALYDMSHFSWSLWSLHYQSYVGEHLLGWKKTRSCKTFLDSLKCLEAARNYMWQFGTKNCIIVMCN